MGGGAATTLCPHPRKPLISRNDPAWAVGLPPPVLRPPCPRKPLNLTSNDPGPSMGVGLPPPVLRPHRKPPISRNDPARAVGLPPPVLHPHCPRKAPRSREQ